mgnify:FL=1|jgi:hypothetical protein|tara:strand:- start:14042 stop:14332 length:291 start_codon:yes stop_codon:yes gene_type:complete
MTEVTKNVVDLDNLKSLSMVIMVPTFLLAGAIGGAFMLGMKMGREDRTTLNAENCGCGSKESKEAETDNGLIIKGSTGNYKLVHTDGVTEMKKRNR